MDTHLNQDNVDMPYKLADGSRAGLDTIQETLHDLRRQNPQHGYLVMFLTLQVNCKSWVEKAKSKPYVWTNAGRPKSKTFRMLKLIDRLTQVQQAALIQLDPLNQDTVDQTCIHASDEHGMTLEQDQ